MLYVLAQQNQTDAKLNLCGTSLWHVDARPLRTYFHGYHGFSRLRSQLSLDTGFNPATASGNLLKIRPVLAYGSMAV